jgi:hypothetical protein
MQKLVYLGVYGDFAYLDAILLSWIGNWSILMKILYMLGWENCSLGLETYKLGRKYPLLG